MNDAPSVALFAVIDYPQDTRWISLMHAVVHTQWGRQLIDHITLVAIGAVPECDQLVHEMAHLGLSVDRLLVVDTGPIVGRSRRLVEGLYTVAQHGNVPSWSLFLAGPHDDLITVIAAEWAQQIQATMTPVVSAFRVLPDYGVHTVQDIEIGVTQAIRTYPLGQRLVIRWNVPTVPSITSALATDAVTSPLVEPLTFLPVDDSVAVRDHIPPNPKDLALEDAERVVAGGRGVGANGFVVLERLAVTLKAGLGASRVAVDLGWMDYAHQVGQTGKQVRARLYLAFGISGAPQHLDGMRDCDTIIAVNKDSKAPIFKVAHLAVVGDAVEVATHLERALHQPLQGSEVKI